MEKEDCIRVGSVSRLHGYKGELSLKLDHDLPFDYSIIDSVFLEINEKLVPYFIDSIRFTPKGYGLTFLEGVDNEARARTLVGKGVFLSRTLLPEMEEDEFILDELTGFIVTDEAHGEVGEVMEVIAHPGNVLLRIEGDDGEVLIPFIDQFVIEVDKSGRCIHVKTPEGLLDLNRDGGE